MPDRYNTEVILLLAFMRAIRIRRCLLDVVVLVTANSGEDNVASQTTALSTLFSDPGADIACHSNHCLLAANGPNAEADRSLKRCLASLKDRILH